ncbi:MAG: AmmeMemoRadiSam system protein A [Anaerolineales bacterium]|nr:AmmeMemoRadiSam system protein A [Anaerolineales bacterium]
MSEQKSHSIADPLSPEERGVLLQLARQALEQGVLGQGLPEPPPGLPERLCQPGASFVTPTRRGQLRGCIGALEARLPLVEDVIEHARAAALQDYRFPPVHAGELAEIAIEISRLTDPQPLRYERPQELPARLRPGVDGVILRSGLRRATFLPQVWDKLPDPVEFLDHLCQKMGLPPDHWRFHKLEAFTYQVEEFHE